MALTQLTKIDGGGISTTSDYRVGVITASKFVGPFDGSAGNFSGIITATGANFSGNVSIGGTLTYEDVTNIDSVGLITARDGIFLPNNKHISLGTGNDMRIYSAAGGLNNSFLKKTGTGPLNFDFQGDFLIRNTNGTMRGKFTGPLGAVELHHSGQKKFETTSSGVSITQDLDVDGHTNLDNVSIAGVTTFSGNIGGTATFQDIDVDGHTNLDNVSVAGVTTCSDRIQMLDNKTIQFGSAAASRTSILYESSSSRTKIRNFNDTLEIGYRNTEIHHTNVARLTFDSGNTFSTAANTTFLGTSYHAGWYPSSNAGTFKLNDNARLAFGTGGDTNLFHNNSHFYLQNTTGNINVTGNVVLNNDLDVDGHTNLDNVSVVGVSTFAGNVNCTSGRFQRGSSTVQDGDAIAGGININGTDMDSSVIMSVFGNDVDFTRISGSKSRNNTVGSHTIVNNNDVLLSIKGFGSDGTNFEEAAQIEMQVDGTPGNNVMPGRIVFKTTTTDGVTERLRITSDGEVRIPTGSNSTNRLTFGGGINIYHDGNMKFENFTGYLKLQSNNQINIDGSQIFLRNAGGTNRWKIDSSGHFLPGAAGTYDIGSTSAEIGDVYLADDKRLKLGSDQDMLIFHNNTHGYVANRKNNLYLEAVNYVMITSADTNGSNQQTSARFLRGGASDLYHSNTLKFSTSSTGVTVTGEVAASQDYPNFRPTLDFNFAAEKKLDPRITYRRTGPASFTNEFGKVVIVGDNSPRFDHDLTTRECKGLLIEESRTNLFMGTSNIGSSGRWLVGGARGSQGANVEGPDGTLTAIQNVYNGTSGDLNIYYTPGEISTSNSTVYTFSVFAKMKPGNSYINSIRMRTYNANRSATFYIHTGSLGSINEGSSSISSRSIIEYPNGWYRCIMTFTSGTDGNQGFQIYLANQENASLNSSSANGDAMYFWGAQLEQAAFPTSFIPTPSLSTATRGADIVEIEGEDFSDFYNQNEGTIMLSASFNSDNRTSAIVTIDDTSNSSEYTEVGYRAGGGGSNSVGAYLRTDASGDQYYKAFASSATAGSEFKVAFGYKDNDYASSANGQTVHTDTSGTTSKVYDRLRLSAVDTVDAEGSGHYRRLVYYGQRLPNNQLVTLTS